VAELETRIWFDGMGRTSAQVDQAIGLAYTMNRTARRADAKQRQSARNAPRRARTAKRCVFLCSCVSALIFPAVAGKNSFGAIMADTASTIGHPEGFKHRRQFLETV
jgi:hypothetical protein